MGGVGDDAVLGAHELLETPGCVVEGFGQGLDLGGPSVAGAWTDRSPLPSAVAAACSSRSGRVTERANATAMAPAATSDTTATPPRVSQTRRTRWSTAVVG